MKLVKVYLDMGEGYTDNRDECTLFDKDENPIGFYLASDIDALMDDPQALAAYLIDRQKGRR